MVQTSPHTVHGWLVLALLFSCQNCGRTTPASLAGRRYRSPRVFQNNGSVGRMLHHSTGQVSLDEERMACGCVYVHKAWGGTKQREFLYIVSREEVLYITLCITNKHKQGKVCVNACGQLCYYITPVRWTAHTLPFPKLGSDMDMFVEEVKKFSVTSPSTDTRHVGAGKR